MVLNGLEVIGQTTLNLVLCLHFFHTKVIDRWYHNAKTIFETQNSRSQFLGASTPEGWLQDTGMLSSSLLSGQIEILYRERRRGVFQECGLRLPFSQRGIYLIRALAVCTNPLLSICTTGGLFNLTNNATIYQASYSWNKQQEFHGTYGQKLPPVTQQRIQSMFGTFSAIYNYF